MDAHGKGNVRAGHGCIGGSDLWNTQPRTGVEWEDSFETDCLQEHSLVEKYRAYLNSEPFKLRVENRALNWLKT